MTRLTSVPARQIVINPNYEVPETDYSNNVLKCRCRYDGHRVWMYSCHNGTDACHSPAGSSDPARQRTHATWCLQLVYASVPTQIVFSNNPSFHDNDV